MDGLKIETKAGSKKKEPKNSAADFKSWPNRSLLQDDFYQNVGGRES